MVTIYPTYNMIKLNSVMYVGAATSYYKFTEIKLIPFSAGLWTEQEIVSKTSAEVTDEEWASFPVYGI